MKTDNKRRPCDFVYANLDIAKGHCDCCFKLIKDIKFMPIRGHTNICADCILDAAKEIERVRRNK